MPLEQVKSSSQSKDMLIIHNHSNGAPSPRAPPSKELPPSPVARTNQPLIDSLQNHPGDAIVFLVLLYAESPSLNIS